MCVHEQYSQVPDAPTLSNLFCCVPQWMRFIHHVRQLRIFITMSSSHWGRLAARSVVREMTCCNHVLQCNHHWRKQPKPLPHSTC